MKYVYPFNEGQKEQNRLLGGKGANLAEMTNLGLPVPSGFTITTQACIAYLEENRLSASLKDEVQNALVELEQKTSKKLGDTTNPLLVSVRSGSMFSMPGMMDTILNLGLNDQTVKSLAELTSDARFAHDCYRRLIQMFGDVVFEIPKTFFEHILSQMKADKGYQNDTQLTDIDLQELIVKYKEVYLNQIGREFPQNIQEQLFLAIEAVFKSWLNPRAKTYRKLHDISEKLGTAVNIQQMVFGNSGGMSGTGVAFTRNPATGQRGLFGEFLVNAQGEDVVAGIRTPQPISDLAQQMPEIYQEFLKIAKQLEAHYLDMQDIEFTIEKGHLFLLQTRVGKRTPQAAFRIAIDLVEEKVITKKQALLRLKPEMMTQLLHPVFGQESLSDAQLLTKGLPASPGAVTGKIYFDALSAKKAHQSGEKVILVRQETSPEDIEGMLISEAIVTCHGGMTSHAAVVARGMGVCCVVGCEQLSVSYQHKQANFNGNKLQEGALISVDGATGEIYQGEIANQGQGDQSDLMIILKWCDELSTMQVWANAENAKDLRAALNFGAKGVGLTRTEHMFFGSDRIFEMRKMIVAENRSERIKALTTLKKMQISDFVDLFSLTQELSCTIRLLDPPLHEFLPQTLSEQEHLAKVLGVNALEIQTRIAQLAELNPMLGHRGCRLAVTYPEIYQMQVQAIIESALIVKKKQPNLRIKPKIMIPLIGTQAELKFIRENLVATIEKMLNEKGVVLDYEIGTMIEVPRACMIADQIAERADFFSFGTNDLTQLTFGYSRDDIGSFLGEYQNKNLLSADPFQSLDIEGVGQLMKLAVEKGRSQKADLPVGVCGEVGGDPDSIAFLKEIGIDYVSCSPYRVPAARLAVAQVEIK